MIEHQGRKRIIVCDNCLEDFEPFDKDSFHEMIAAAKAERWEIKPDDRGHWIHHCSDCAPSKESPAARAKRMFGG